MRLHRTGLPLLLFVAAGCESVEVVSLPTGNPPPLQTNPVTFTVAFNQRADVGTFRATIDPNPGYPTAGGIDITSEFSGSRAPGGQSTAVVNVPHPCHLYPAGCIGEHRLRVEADMSPRQVFDSTGHEQRFRLQGTTTTQPPPPPSPDFRVSITPADQAITWGASSAYTVTVRSINGFNQPVSLSAANLPGGSTATFSPATVIPAANGSAGSILTVGTTEAVTQVGATEFRVTGTASGNPPRNDRATMTVRRTPGPFSQNIYPLRSGDFNCPPVMATVGAGPSVQFTSPLGTTRSSPMFGAGYDISPNCRTGVVIPPPTGIPPNQQFFVHLYNLLFESTTGAPDINHPYDFPSVATDIRFSPDASIVAVVGPGGAGGLYSIRLHDVIRHASSSSGFFDGALTSLTLAGDRVTVNGSAVNGPFSFDLQVA